MHVFVFSRTLELILASKDEENQILSKLQKQPSRSKTVISFDSTIR
jgi:hypothetical protein